MAAYDISATQKAIVAYGVSLGSGGSGGSSDWSDITNKPIFFHKSTFTDSTNIVINHRMQKNPGVRVLDTAGTEWYGATITYTDLNNIKVQFNYLFGGTIFLF